jgi:PPK2 family polyphosphate:nucleotide phosphotransferase
MKAKDFQVQPGATVDLDRVDPDDTGGFRSSEEVEAKLNEKLAHIAELQERLYAEGSRALLLLLQGMDTAGKDGTIKSVVRDVNPQGLHIVSFKAPSKEELAHDFLWRVEARTPPRGMIGIFNRSHYEDVGIVRVHDLVPKEVWSKRFDQINDWERRLSETYITFVKVFLHISKKEQKERLEDRLKEPTKHWKFNPDDLKERSLWKQYKAAYEDALSKCSTPWAPWHVVPADRKWYRNLVVADIVEEALRKMDPKFPKPTFDPAAIQVE